MSSKILDQNAAFEPMPWRATKGTPPPPPAAGIPSPTQPIIEAHHPKDLARIQELETSLRILEKRLQDDTRNAREQGHQQGVAVGMQQEAAKWTDAIGRLGRAIDDMSKSKARFRAEVEED